MRSYEDSFDLAGLRELQREAMGLVQAFAAADDPDVRVDGFDASRTVRVTVDGSGQVVGVEIGSSWRRVIGSAGLGPAVVEAVQAAERERLEALAGDPGGSAEPSGPLLPEPVGPGPSGAPSDPAAVEATRDLLYLAMDAMDRLDEVGRALTQVADGPVRGDSPGRRVVVTVEAGRLASVEFDQRWLADAGVEGIAEQVRAAFAAAYRARPRAVVSEALEHPTLRELREVTADPHQLLRRLGLGPRG